MAIYQTREPLLDENTAQMLERRGQELLGIGLLALAFLFALMLISYTPSDPGWMVASDAPVANYLGSFGAALSSTLIVIFGLGIWSIPALLAVWGVRYLAHIGAERVLSRVFFGIFAVLSACLYATTLQPSEAWIAAHGFGLGGLLGDTLLGTLLGIMPTSAAFGIKFLSLITAALMAGLMGYVMGFDRSELAAIRRFLLGGAVGSYASLVGAGAQMQARVQTAAPRSQMPLQMGQPQMGQPPMVQQPDMQPSYHHPEPMRAAPSAQDYPHAASAPKGLFSRLAHPAAQRPDPAPELIERSLPQDAPIPAHDDARLRARISDVVRNIAANPPPPRPTPPRPMPAPNLRSEPPLGRAPLMAQIAPQPQTLSQFTAAEDDMGYGDWVPDHHYTAQEPARTPILSLGPDMRRAKVEAPVKKPLAPSRRAMDEAQPRLKFEETAPQYDLPPLSLLTNPDTVQRYTLSHEALEENARMLESVLDDYGVKGEIVSVRPGPVVTMYELEPAPGLKASRVIGLADDIARSMSALSARVSTVPGRTVIGIELPNTTREKVVLREIIAARDFGDSAMRLPLALGKDIGGDPVVANLAKMPHLLIAGTTGSGKSVAINTMILSLLYKLSPEECRLIMIDPKMLELSVYDGIPHLLSPVVTDPKKAVVALKWVVSEMEERYRKMSKMGVRNIEGYNGRVRESLAKGEMFRRTIQTGFDENTGDPVFETEEFQPIVLPYIVVVVDEMADLMMVAGKEIEACIQRLAQMARASGIHLIMATQRPSVDVITGTIKANFPTRISFQVTSKIDSRTILGEQGAEQLLGMGDMLFMAGGGRISRIHGPFVSDEEVEEIVNHLKSYGPPSYVSGVVESRDEEGEVDAMLGLGGEASDDSLYDQAVAIVAKDRKCSTSYIQRKLGIGYNKAARLVEQMEENLVVTTANHVGKREILLPEA
ncbi:MAG: DNA translocase FtsK [Cypionkella sp.]|nr:DNA translocase FtsK [Cypionkella sp.]